MRWDIISCPSKKLSYPSTLQLSSFPSALCPLPSALFSLKCKYSTGHDMTVLLESPWYQQFVKDGILNLIMRMLRRKFGELEPQILETVQRLSPEKLEDLGEELFDFSQVADLVAWLQEHEEATEV
ncbi:MAG: DUF4351 domain-containing protein [Symploca sp. SIO2D2]|nr:DUF4351 domain-containing protein [Symploca sp. SIO2D2]